MTQLTLPVAPPSPSAPAQPAKCEYCQKDAHLIPSGGNNIGSGPLLAKKMYPSGKEKHEWYTGSHSLQAHHIISSEALANDAWHQVCNDFGYDINEKENGVMLPWRMPLACQASAPLHRSNHDSGRAGTVAYPAKVKQLTQQVLDRALAGEFCGDPGALKAEMDSNSSNILKNIDTFSWTITADGADYKPGGKGCSGVTSLTDKPSSPCPASRHHGLNTQATGKTIPARTSSLQVGK